MFKRTNVVRNIAISAVLVASSATAQTGLARRDAPLLPQNKPLTQNQAEKSLVVAGSVKGGKVSKLVDNSGDLNDKDLAQSKSAQITFASYGK